MILTSAATNADGSIIYFGSSSGTFYAFTSTGVMKWFYPAQDAIYSAPTYSAAGYVSFGSNDYFVYVLNATTGTLLWRYKTGFVVTGSPAFLTNATATTMFVGSQDYNMYAFRTTNPGWATKNFTDTPNYPILFLDGSTNTPSALLGTGIYTLPYCQAMCTATNNCLYFIQDPAAHHCWLKSDYDYFSSTGTQIKGAYFKNYVKWTYATGGPIVSTPAVGTVSGVSAVFFGSTDFIIYALSASKGTLLWSVQTGGSVAASALVNPFNSATLYINSRDMYMYALTTATGSVSWKANVATRATAGSGAGVYTTFEGLVSVETTYCGTLSSFKYLGCYVDGGASNRALLYELFGSTAGYKACFQLADAQGLRYVGFQWWNGPSTGTGQCFGGNSLSSAVGQGTAANCAQVQTSDGSLMYSAGGSNAVYDILTSMVVGDWTIGMTSTSCVALRSASNAASQSLSPQFPVGLMWALELINNKVASGSGTVSVSKTYTTAGKFLLLLFQCLNTFLTI